jgi:Ca2+-binding EF-hand superfamily protein
MGLHRKGLDYIQGKNPLNNINKVELEKVFQQNKVPVKEMRMSRRQKVLDLCKLLDKNNSGSVTFAEFRRISQACNYKIHDPL